MYWPGSFCAILEKTYVNSYITYFEMRDNFSLKYNRRITKGLTKKKKKLSNLIFKSFSCIK